MRLEFPALISISEDSASLLSEMAKEMGVSLDELISGIAEDSVTGLLSGPAMVNQKVPDSITRNELEEYLNK